eukprot:SAG31_NODE_282_length_18516_cov_9.338600_7_plen_202_part_00
MFQPADTSGPQIRACSIPPTSLAEAGSAQIRDKDEPNCLLSELRHWACHRERETVAAVASDALASPESWASLQLSDLHVAEFSRLASVCKKDHAHRILPAVRALQTEGLLYLKDAKADCYGVVGPLRVQRVLREVVKAEQTRSAEVDYAGVACSALLAGLQQHRLLQPACLTRRQASGHLDRAVASGYLYELGPKRYKLTI